MPTYEYRCYSCKHEFEEFQRITAKPLQKCPKCGGKVQRIITGGSCVIFKGSGFYINDYGRKGKKPLDTPPSTSPEPGKIDPAKDKKKD
jgi:putative FmdB family regulatory protein